MTENKIIGIKELKWQFFFADRGIWIRMIDLYKGSNDIHKQQDISDIGAEVHNIKKSMNFNDYAYLRIGYDKDFDLSKSSASLAEKINSTLSRRAKEDFSVNFPAPINILKAGDYLWKTIVLDGYGLGAKVMLATILELAKLNPEVLNRVIFFSSEGEFFPEEGTNKLDLINKIKQKFSKKQKLSTKKLLFLKNYCLYRK